MTTIAEPEGIEDDYRWLGDLVVANFAITLRKGTTDMADDAKTPAPAAVPTFAPIPVADLPSAVRETTPETLALGNAIWPVIKGGTTAAQDPATYTADAATKRAAVLKRAALAVAGELPAGKTISARVTGTGDERRVAVLITDAKPRKPKTTATPTT